PRVGPGMLGGRGRLGPLVIVGCRGRARCSSGRLWWPGSGWLRLGRSPRRCTRWGPGRGGGGRRRGRGGGGGRRGGARGGRGGGGWGGGAGRGGGAGCRG